MDSEKLESPKETSSKKWIIIGSSVTLLLIVGIFSGFYILISNQINHSFSVLQKQISGLPGAKKVNAANVTEGNLVQTEDSQQSETEKKEQVLPHFYKLSRPFTVNLLTKGESAHYLELDLAIMTRDEALVKKVELIEPMLRGELVKLLTGIYFEDLNTTEGKEVLQKNVLKLIQDVVYQETGSNNIEQVFFTRFVMQ